MTCSRSPHLVSPAVHPVPVLDAITQEFPCEICGTIGREEFPGSDSYLDPDGGLLHEAQTTPANAWVCCRRCLSQLMFQKATDTEHEMLIRLNEALAAVRETVPGLEALITAWAPESEQKVANVLFTLKQSAVLAEALVGITDEPAWVNEPSREDVLDREMLAIREISAGIKGTHIESIHRRACRVTGGL